LGFSPALKKGFAFVSTDTIKLDKGKSCGSAFTKRYTVHSPKLVSPWLAQKFGFTSNSYGRQRGKKPADEQAIGIHARSLNVNKKR
jgi:hypothetical protein